MEFKRIALPAFSVIGMEGSTDEGAGFVKRLWDAANARFGEVAPLAHTDETGMPRIWGLMSDRSRAFRPWENGFTEGLYLAGVEVGDHSAPPMDWTKWTSPAYEYAVAPMEGPDSFSEALSRLKAEGLALVGAVYDRIDPATGATFLYFPVRRTAN
jgi:hypothetical protein